MYICAHNCRLSSEHLAILVYQKENCVVQLEGRVRILLFCAGMHQYSLPAPRYVVLYCMKFHKSVNIHTIYCFYSNNIITICNNSINKSFNFLYKDKGHFQLYLLLRSDFQHPHSKNIHYVYTRHKTLSK